MTKCSKCLDKAIIRIEWKGKNYCSKHFILYFLGQVQKVLGNEVRGKVLVAVSGGKDSAVCLEALTHFNLEISAIHINLGIGSFSEHSLKAAESLCKKLGIDLEVIDLKKDYGFTFPQIEKMEKGATCEKCGMIKRYLINKYAFENGYDFVATGHNLNDIVASALNNLASGSIYFFRGFKPLVKGINEYKLVARIKPLYFLKEGEISVYAKIKGLPFSKKRCPFAKEAPTEELKKSLNLIEKRRPGILRKFAYSFVQIEDSLKRERKMRLCEKCGYATVSRICKFCRIVGKIKPN